MPYWIRRSASISGVTAVLKRLKLRGKGTTGALLVLLVVLMALLAPVLAPHDPNAQNLMLRLKPPAWEQGGLPAHLLGTDSLGRDLLSRTIYGARISLLVSLMAVSISAVVGSLLGLVAGYRNTWLQTVILRVVDITLSIPFILLVIAIAGSLGSSLRNTILALGFTRWVPYTRVTFAQVLSIRERDFVQAAQAYGAKDDRILLRHIFPNLVSPLIVLATLDIGFIVIIESALSFLGLGVPPEIPSWGAMLSDGRNYIDIAWWASTIPGLAIMLTVLGANLVGDWTRDRLDPQSRR